MEGALTIEKGFEELASQRFLYDRQALAFLGIRTAVVVATILSIPDGIALIPASSTVTAWVLALVGCWTTALVLWFVFFVGFMNAMRLFVGGIEIGPHGIKLWRFGRLIPWDKVEAVEIEDEDLFSRIFSFERKVKRLTLFKHIDFRGKGKKAGLPPGAVKKGFFDTILVPNYIASFFFSEKDFEEMCRAICRYRFQLDSGDYPVLLLPLAQLPAVRKAHHFLRWQRILVSVLIALGITMFLSRKAVVLYSYNEGQKFYRLRDYASAEQRFLTAVTIERSFAPAWHGLASAEFHLGRFENASRNWKESLKWKPDFVEAKVSLAYLSLQQRNFDEAEKLINSALALAPANPTALLNRADLYLRTGHVRAATQDARLVISQSESLPTDQEVFMATCLLAQAKLIQGKTQEAAQILAPLPVTEAKLAMGENLTYRLLVGAQIELAQGHVSKAERLARLALKRSESLDTLLVMAQVRLARKDYDVAQAILERCKAMMPNNPWVYIHACQVNLERHHKDVALRNLNSAEQCGRLDPLCMSRIADLYLKLGENDKALEAARESLKLEPINPVAQNVVERLDPDSGKS